MDYRPGSFKAYLNATQRRILDMYGAGLPNYDPREIAVVGELVRTATDGGLYEIVAVGDSSSLIGDVELRNYVTHQIKWVKVHHLRRVAPLEALGEQAPDLL